MANYHYSDEAVSRPAFEREKGHLLTVSGQRCDSDTLHTAIVAFAAASPMVTAPTQVADALLEFIRTSARKSSDIVAEVVETIEALTSFREIETETQTTDVEHPSATHNDLAHSSSAGFPPARPILLDEPSPLLPPPPIAHPLSPEELIAAERQSRALLDQLKATVPSIKFSYKTKHADLESFISAVRADKKLYKLLCDQAAVELKGYEANLVPNPAVKASMKDLLATQKFVSGTPSNELVDHALKLLLPEKPLPTHPQLPLRPTKLAAVVRAFLIADGLPERQEAIELVRKAALAKQPIEAGGKTYVLDKDALATALLRPNPFEILVILRLADESCVSNNGKIAIGTAEGLLRLKCLI